jgi:integrase
MESRKLVFVRRRQRGRKGHDEISGSIAMDIQRAPLEGRKLESAVALWTGARRDEIGGLRWSEVDLDAGTLSVPGT